jgi:hypothetical protein
LILRVPAMIVFAALVKCRGGLLAADGGLKPAAPALLLILVAALGVYRSGSELVAMSLYDQPKVAAKIDPGNYRILRRVHARAAHALFPYAR